MRKAVGVGKARIVCSWKTRIVVCVVPSGVRDGKAGSRCKWVAGVLRSCASKSCNRPTHSLVDGNQLQVAPSAVVEFRAGVAACSRPLLQHLSSLVQQGLTWQGQVSGVGASGVVDAPSPEAAEERARAVRVECVSSFSVVVQQVAPTQQAHATEEAAQAPEASSGSYRAHSSRWADLESLAAVMAFANHRRSLPLLSCNTCYASLPGRCLPARCRRGPEVVVQTRKTVLVAHAQAVWLLWCSR